MTEILELQELQLGKETTWGTPVAPTVKMMDVYSVNVNPATQAKIFTTVRGSLQPGHASALTGQGGGASVAGHATYDDIPYFLEGMLGVVTPSGAGPYTRDGNAPTTAVQSPRIHTLVYGNSSQAYGLTGALVNSLTISGTGGPGGDSDLKYSANFIGEQVETDAVASLSDRTTTPAMGNEVALYIDAWGGTIGSTQFTDVFFNFSLSLNANFLLFGGLGSLAATNYTPRRMLPGSNTLALSLEFDTTAKAYLDEIIGGSAVHQKQIRIKATSGTSIIQLDFAGTQVSAPSVNPNNNGIITVDLAYQGENNSTLGNFFKYSIVNGVSTLA